jgi:hypothetical protein
MRRGHTGCLWLLLGCLAGCANKEGNSAQSAWNSRFKPLAVTEERRGQIEIAMVQVPKEESLRAVPNSKGVELASLNQVIIDHCEQYLSDGLWRDVDEQVVPLEVRPKLEDNGYRVGLLRNALPAKLQQLLGTPQSCPFMKRLVAKAEHEWFWPLGAHASTLAVKVTQDGKPDNRELEKPEFGLLIQATSLPEGKTKLVMTPMLRHGSAMFQAKPNRERTGWELNNERPEEKFTKLSWEMTLKPNEYVVIGGWNNKQQTLGQHSFVEKEHGRHRVLVLRGVPAIEPLVGLEGKGPLPLALQSLIPSRQEPKRTTPPREVRGQSP